MRIRYWSSDVCSSDLAGPALLVGQLRVLVQLAPPGGHVGVEVGDTVDDRHWVRFRVPEAAQRSTDARLRQHSVVWASTWGIGPASADAHVALDVLVQQEIGRASCRERVCQYV